MIIAVFFHINTSSTLQMQTNLKPCIYMKQPVEDNLNKIKYLDQDSEVKMTQYKHLHDFLVNEIQTEGNQSQAGPSHSLQPNQEPDRANQSFVLGQP